jgi:LysM repeat protein
VPASVIMQANNITAPATLYPGERLVIPRYKSSRARLRPATTCSAE